MGDPLAILWSSIIIKSEEGSGILRREIMTAHVPDYEVNLCLKKWEHICQSKKKKAKLKLRK